MDWIAWVFSCVAILAGAFRIVEYLTTGYLDAAERINWEWISSNSPPTVLTNTRKNKKPGSKWEDKIEENESAVKYRDLMWITKHKDLPVGTLILRICSSGCRDNINTTTMTSIRAWTVRQAYRHIGIGGSLLRRAIEECRVNGWKNPSFAKDHVHSLRILPGWFNGVVDMVEDKARGMLEREARNMNKIDKGMTQNGDC